jgi:hypothetical protein
MSEPIIKELELLGYKGKILGLEYWESTLAYKKLYNLRYMTAFHVTHYRPDILPSSFMGDFKSKFYRIPSALAAIGYDASRTIGSIYSSAKSVRTTPLLDSIKKSKNINGILSRLRMGWDKSMERAMSVSSPRAGGANTGILIVPNGLSLAAGKKKSR